MTRPPRLAGLVTVIAVGCAAIAGPAIGQVGGSAAAIDRTALGPAEVPILPDSLAALVELPGAAEMTAGARILYLSRTSVYIDKGQADGVGAAAALRVYRDGLEIALLQVSYLAARSASCRILAATAALETSDEVRYRPAAPPEAAPAPPEPAPEPEPPLGQPLTLPPREREPRCTGRAAVEVKWFNDAEDPGQDFRQPALALRMDTEGIGRLPLDLRIHMRSRHNERIRALDADRPETEWQHRFYEVSLSYGAPDSHWRVAIGRLFARDLRGAASWDGGLLEYRAGTLLRLAVFGGGVPGLTDSEPDWDQQQWGGSLTLVTGERIGTHYRGTAGFVGQYASGEVSREFLVLANELSLGRTVNLYQNLELDLNRGWREELSGETRTLSRLSALISYRLFRGLELRAAYDRYKNIRRIETRNIPDSLFADPELEGLHIGVRGRIAHDLHIGGRIGYRDRSDEEKRPFFGNADLTWSDLLGTATSLRASYAYADGRYTRSHVPSLDLERGFGPSVRIGAGVGFRGYEGIEGETFSADGQWLRLYGSYRVTRHIDLQGLLTSSSGDIGAGQHGFLRLGYRW